ncbi:MAG: DUF4282 domain-containing protein [Alphaproteobacteria bacterium]|nr:DUF4282 domain-containing protein [Alphaproteobacteria bacterium]
MFSFNDLFQWDRFITPTIIKNSYLALIALICLHAVLGVYEGLDTLKAGTFPGLLKMGEAVVSALVAIVFTRIITEFILIVFRINDHLGAIREQRERTP